MPLDLLQAPAEWTALQRYSAALGDLEHRRDSLLQIGYFGAALEDRYFSSAVRSKFIDDHFSHLRPFYHSQQSQATADWVFCHEYFTALHFRVAYLDWLRYQAIQKLVTGAHDLSLSVRELSASAFAILSPVSAPTQSESESHE